MDYLYLIYSLILGMTFASFATVLAERLVNHETLMGRSHCDHCKHDISFIHVIPFFGYFISLGRCKHCRQKINIKYPLIELTGGLLYMLSFIIFGISIELLISFIAIFVLLVESLADINNKIVIDRVWIVGFISVVILRIINKDIIDYLISSASIFLSFWLLAYITSKIFKKETLGGGDIKLYLFIGLIITIWPNLLSLFLASLLALIYIFIFKKFKDYIPFVPFISIAVIIMHYFGSDIISWYLTLVGM